MTEQQKIYRAWTGLGYAVELVTWRWPRQPTPAPYNWRSVRAWTL